MNRIRADSVLKVLDQKATRHIENYIFLKLVKKKKLKQIMFVFKNRTNFNKFSKEKK